MVLFCFCFFLFFVFFVFFFFFVLFFFCCCCCCFFCFVFFLFSFFFFLLLLFSFIIVILNYCKMDYKVFVIRNNKLIYLSRMKSCLWGWSCYHYSLAQRPISHRIHMFLATLSIICKCGILGIGCVSVWCASERGFLFQVSATYRSL